MKCFLSPQVLLSLRASNVSYRQFTMMSDGKTRYVQDLLILINHQGFFYSNKADYSGMLKKTLIVLLLTQEFVVIEFVDARDIKWTKNQAGFERTNFI